MIIRKSFLLFLAINLFATGSILPVNDQAQIEYQQQSDVEKYDLINIAKSGFKKIHNFVRCNKKKTAAVAFAIIGGYFFRKHEKTKIEEEGSPFNKKKIGNAEIQQIEVEPQAGAECAQNALKNAILLKKSVLDPDNKEEYLKLLDDNTVVTEWVNEAKDTNRGMIHRYVEAQFYDACFRLNIGNVEHAYAWYNNPENDTVGQFPEEPQLAAEEREQVSRYMQANNCQQPFVNYYLNWLQDKTTEMPQETYRQGCRMLYLPERGSWLDNEGIGALIESCHRRPKDDPFRLDKHDDVIIFNRVVKDPNKLDKIEQERWINNIQQLRQPGTHAIILSNNPEKVDPKKDAKGHWISMVIHRPENPKEPIQYYVANSWKNENSLFRREVKTLIDLVEQKDDEEVKTAGRSLNETGKAYEKLYKEKRPQVGFFRWLARKLLFLS